jgi:hypothetical protein
MGTCAGDASDRKEGLSVVLVKNLYQTKAARCEVRILAAHPRRAFCAAARIRSVSARSMRSRMDSFSVYSGPASCAA